MPVFVLGLNHNSAPLDVRERVVFPMEALTAALPEVTRLPGVKEAVIISTCNRTEIYAALDPQSGEPLIGSWLSRSRKLDWEWLRGYVYQYRGADAVRHLLRVACGLDSMVLGEPQILGQTKTSYLEAVNSGAAGRMLDRLFQHAFSVAKDVRTRTSIGENPVSVAFAAVSLARQIFGDLDRRRALLIGAGETIDLTAQHLSEQRIQSILVANRSLEKARRLAARHGGGAISLGDIPQHLAGADIVVTSTASPLPILGKGMIERAFKARKHRPMFLVDLAVPRDIEPEAGEMEDVYLYSVDDLKEVIEENLRSRREAAAQAEQIIDFHVERFLAWLRSLDTIDLIRVYREQASTVKEEVIARAHKRLARGESVDEVMQYLATTLTNKLIHAPTVGLRDAAARGDGARVEAAKRLLDIEPEGDKQT